MMQPARHLISFLRQQPRLLMHLRKMDLLLVERRLKEAHALILLLYERRKRTVVRIQFLVVCTEHRTRLLQRDILLQEGRPVA